jgi:hypothetical protein
MPQQTLLSMHYFKYPVIVLNPAIISYTVINILYSVSLVFCQPLFFYTVLVSHLQSAFYVQRAVILTIR